MIDACCTHSHLINSGVTGPSLTIFLRIVVKSLPFNLLKLKLWSLIYFGMPVYRMKVELANFENLAT